MRPGGPSLLMIALLIVCATAARARTGDGEVRLVRTRTGEALRVRRGRLPSPAAINRFLRCPADRKYTLVDPRLVAAAVNAARHFERVEVRIISAFRTARLNAAMRAEGRNVALRSRHVNGQALDLRVPGVPIDRLCRYFRRLRVGGVGCYRRLKFVHIDVGPLRSWSG